MLAREAAVQALLSPFHSLDIQVRTGDKKELIILEVATRNAHEASLKLLYQLVNYCVPVSIPPKIQDSLQEIYKIIEM